MRRAARRPRAVVASGHAAATAAARDVLGAGGNAFDAAVACGFASAVAEPGLTSLGGGGFLLARDARGRSTLFDFFTDSPGRGRRRGAPSPDFVPVTVVFRGSTQVFHVGLGAVAVPGVLRGYLHVQRRLGRLPLADVIAPAVRLARAGVRVNPKQAYVLNLLRPVLTLTAGARALFAPGGTYLRAGDRFRNPDLAAFLETVAHDGDRDFYEGALACTVDREMRDGGGLLTAADLRAYRVVARRPLGVAYRGLRLLTNPPPSFGGVLLARSLRLLETVAPRGLRRPFGSPGHLALLVALFQEIERGRARAAAGGAARVRRAAGGTTHVSVCDAEGNVASMTTSNGECSGYVVPGTGVVLNNMMGEDDLHPAGFHSEPPGRRVASMMSPSVLLDGDGVRLVLGSGGSKRIRTALLQVVSNVVDFGMDVGPAVGAPRVHWDGASVQVEPGFPATALAALGRRWKVNAWRARDVYFGGVNAVAPDGRGAADPRRGGRAARV